MAATGFEPPAPLLGVAVGHSSGAHVCARECVVVASGDRLYPARSEARSRCE